MVSISITQRHLLKALQCVYRGIDANPQREILRNFLFRAHADRLEIIGANEEQELRCVIKQSFDREMAFTVPARTLHEICRALPEDTVVELLVEKDKLQIKTYKSKYALVSPNASEFQMLEVGDQDANITCNAAVLTGMLERTFFAVAQKDMRYYLNGLLFDIKGNELTLVGTDGHRMAVESGGIDGVSREDWERKVIVPRRSVSEIKHLLTGAEGSVELSFSERHIQLRRGDMVFSSLLINGSYPNYERVIPERSDAPITVSRADFISGLTRVSAIFQDRHSGVELSILKGEMKLVGRNKEGEEVETAMEATCGEGEEFKTGFNIQYLLDALNAMDCAEVRLDLGKDKNSSLLMTPVGKGDGDGQEGPLYVIMPMLL